MARFAKEKLLCLCISLQAVAQSDQLPLEIHPACAHSKGTGYVICILQMI